MNLAIKSVSKGYQGAIWEVSHTNMYTYTIPVSFISVWSLFAESTYQQSMYFTESVLLIINVVCNHLQSIEQTKVD